MQTYQIAALAVGGWFLLGLAFMWWLNNEGED